LQAQRAQKSLRLFLFYFRQLLTFFFNLNKTKYGDTGNQPVDLGFRTLTRKNFCHWASALERQHHNELNPLHQLLSPALRKRPEPHAPCKRSGVCIMPRHTVILHAT
jgi:hypothetical protein